MSVQSVAISCLRGSPTLLACAWKSFEGNRAAACIGTFASPSFPSFGLQRAPNASERRSMGALSIAHFPGKSRMAIFPAAIEIEGEWNVGPTLDYTVVFLNPSFVGERLPTAIANPTLAFEHDELKRGLSELCREAASPDNVFNLLAEGWATQALAHIVRVSGKNHEHHTELRGGLPRRSLRLLDEYVRENLARPISLAELSGIAGLSKRHFLRAFQDSVGATPYRYVISLRIDEAKRRLSETDDSITDVALATGFGQAQHFSTSFRKATGLTPSSFRHRSLG
jgi:AraC family transcriptional regulator